MPMGAPSTPVPCLPRIRLDAHAPDRADFDDACDALRRHLVVAYPTDTLYALAVDPRSDAAIQRLYAVKNRPLDRAVPLIAADIAQVGRNGRNAHSAGAGIGRALLAGSPDDPPRGPIRGSCRSFTTAPAPSPSGFPPMR